MKTSHAKTNERQALTLLEVVIVVATILVAVSLLLPFLARSKTTATHVSCSNNLKQIGLAFRIFSTDSTDNFPMQVSTNRGGSGEFGLPSEVFRHFQALSNELGTPIILVCPQDRRIGAPGFDHLANSNISYFVGLNAQAARPDVMLSGDSNLTTNEVAIHSGLFPITTQTRIAFTRERHAANGNICMGDGSVNSLSGWNQRKVFPNTNSFTNWLAVP